jgi:hypothetical protein
MKLTDDDYRSLAVQCAVQDFGRIDKDGGTVYVSMDVFVDYDPLEEELTGGHIPVLAECRVKDFDFDTADGSEVDFDPDRLEEITYDILMKY